MDTEDRDSDINFRLPLAHKHHLKHIVQTINRKNKSTSPSHDPITLSLLLRSTVACLVNGHAHITDTDIIEIKELTEQIRRVGTNINQLAHAYNAGLLVHPVNVRNMFQDLQQALDSHSRPARWREIFITG